MNILKLLSSSGFIQYNKYVARTIGVSEAIILGELCSRANLYHFQEFYCSQDTLRFDTALSERQVRQALRNLEENKILTITKKGNPCRNWYYLNEDVLSEILSRTDTNEEEFSESVQTSSDKMTQLDIAECRNYFRQNDTTTSDKMTQHLKEINKENINKEIKKDKDDFSFSESFNPISEKRPFAKVLYEYWKSKGLPIASENVWLNTFGQTFRPLTGINTEEILKGVDNYAEALSLGGFFAQNANPSFDNFCKQFSTKWAEGAYIRANYLPKQNNEYAQSYNQPTVNSQLNKDSNGFDKYDKQGNEIRRNELNQPIDRFGFVDNVQFWQDMKVDMKRHPERYDDNEKLLLENFSWFQPSEKMLSTKIGD